MSTAHKSVTQNDVSQSNISTLRTGLLFIVAGSLIYAAQQGLVRDWFWWFILVWGVTLLFEVIIKLSITRYRHTILSPLIWGTLFVGFACHQLYGFEEWWPIALIVIGVGIILKGERDEAH